MGMCFFFGDRSAVDVKKYRPIEVGLKLFLGFQICLFE